MQIHDIKREHKNKTKTRVGRGGKRGKTSGKGHKGQKARAGSKIRPEWRDIIKRLPKLRGRGVNQLKPINPKPQGVNVSTIESSFEAGAIISPKTLVAKKLVNKISGKLPTVKILGTGEITKKVVIIGCQISATAKEKVEKAGGTIK
jgi:large subunit ribosomal protein L15